MFTGDETIIDYHYGTNITIPAPQVSLNKEQRARNNLLLSAFTTVRNHCENACVEAVLKDLPEESVEEYRQNSRIAQPRLKTLLDANSQSFENQRLTEHFGDDARDVVHELAFEYNQSDIHFLKLNQVEFSDTVRNLTGIDKLNKKIDNFKI